MTGPAAERRSCGTAHRWFYGLTSTTGWHPRHLTRLLSFTQFLIVVLSTLRYNRLYQQKTPFKKAALDI